MQYIQSVQPKSVGTWDLSEYKFTTALEASKIVDDLKYQARQLNYNKDIRKLLDNCDVLVGKLGNAEVKARQLHKPYLANKPREELASAIDYAEKMLLIMRLTQ
jgi:hypothetical protein